jgi:hypothetical protein
MWAYVGGSYGMSLATAPAMTPTIPVICAVACCQCLMSPKFRRSIDVFQILGFRSVFNGQTLWSGALAIGDAGLM